MYGTYYAGHKCKMQNAGCEIPSAPVRIISAITAISSKMPPHTFCAGRFSATVFEYSLYNTASRDNLASADEPDPFQIGR